MALYAGALPVLLLPADRRQLRDAASAHGRGPAAVCRALAPARHQPFRTGAGRADRVGALPAAGRLCRHWLMVCALNLYLAGRIARASGRLGRDWPDLACAELIRRDFPCFWRCARAGSCRRRHHRLVGVSFTGALLVAYLLCGLALMHFIARRPRALAAVARLSGTSLPVGPSSCLCVVLAGLLDPTLNSEARFGPSPPST